MTAQSAGAEGFPQVRPGTEPDAGAVAPGEGPDAAGAQPDTRPGRRLVVCAPLWPEARAVRAGIGDGGEVRVSGYGPGGARKQAGRLRRDAFGALAVAGTS